MTIPDRIEAASRQLASAARSYAAGHTYLATVDLRGALVSIAEALTSLVHEVVR